MNTSGQIGGILSPVIFAVLIRNSVTWSAPLYWTAVLYLLGAMCWYFVHPERPLGAITPSKTVDSVG
jgi:sugar phosphate permease